MQEGQSDVQSDAPANKTEKNKRRRRNRNHNHNPRNNKNNLEEAFGETCGEASATLPKNSLRHKIWAILTTLLHHLLFSLTHPMLLPLMTLVLLAAMINRQQRQLRDLQLDNFFCLTALTKRGAGGQGISSSETENATRYPYEATAGDAAPPLPPS